MKKINQNSCYILGDLHGNWNYLNKFINKKNPSCILQTGDFGFWPKFNNKTTLGTRVVTSNGIVKKKWFQYGMKMHNTKLYWCDGNHEDHWALKELTNNSVKPIEIHKNIFYMPRCSILTTKNNKNILFMGGATSIDKHHRVLGRDWFPSEIISYRDIENLPDIPIDIVISHTCPREFLKEILICNLAKFNDPCYDALSHVLMKYNPSLWYFGHFHHYKEGFYNNTKWFCLNMANNTGWFTKLKI